MASVPQLDSKSTTDAEVQDRSRNDAPLKTVPVLEVLLMMPAFGVDCVSGEIVLLLAYVKWLLLSLRAPSLSASLVSLFHSTGASFARRRQVAPASHLCCQRRPSCHRRSSSSSCSKTSVLIRLVSAALNEWRELAPAELLRTHACGTGASTTYCTSTCSTAPRRVTGRERGASRRHARDASCLTSY